MGFLWIFVAFLEYLLPLGLIMGNFKDLLGFFRIFGDSSETFTIFIIFEGSYWDISGSSKDLLGIFAISGAFCGIYWDYRGFLKIL